jgi:hypothetical protein
VVGRTAKYHSFYESVGLQNASTEILLAGFFEK